MRGRERGRRGRVAYNRFFFLEMSRKMRVPCDSGVKLVRIKKLNVIFGWIFAENKIRVVEVRYMVK